MDLTNAFDFVQKYAREYVYFVLSFLKHRPKGEGDSWLSLSDGQLLRFVFISTGIGALFQALFIKHTALPQVDALSAIIIELSYWIFLGILVQVGLTLFGRPIEAGQSFAAVFRVFPVCFALGAYAAFIFHYGSFAFSSDPRQAQTVAAYADFIVQWCLVAGYFGLSLSRVTAAPRWRRRVVYVFILALIALVDIVVMFGAAPPVQSQAAQPAAKPAAASAPAAKGNPHAT
jgi:hypothetical protein